MMRFLPLLTSPLIVFLVHLDLDTSSSVGASDASSHPSQAIRTRSSPHRSRCRKRSYDAFADRTDSERRHNRGASNTSSLRPPRRKPRTASFQPRAKTGGLSHTIPPLGGPAGAPPLPVLTTKDPHIIERWLSENVPFFGNGDNDSNSSDETSYSILGFDVEQVAKPPWNPDRQSLPDGPSTIQLSTPDSCLIVQLAICGDGSTRHAPDILRQVINNPNIIKVGVGIDDDALECYRWSRESYRSIKRSIEYPKGVSSSMEKQQQQPQQQLWEMTSRFDLGCILPKDNPSRRSGLRDLAQTILGVEMIKNKRLAMSNWAVRHLTMEQISYAARDAWVAAAIMEKLQKDNEQVFGTKALLAKDFMKNQRSVEEMDERAVIRKRAKEELKLIKENEREGKETGVKISSEKEERKEDLYGTLALYRPDPPPTFSEDAFALPFY
eukprot:scaffold2187_cov180-Alexandrium_tamarense.AAC.7